MKLVEFTQKDLNAKKEKLEELSKQSNFIGIWKAKNGSIMCSWHNLSREEAIGMLEHVKLDILIEKWLEK